MTVDVTKPEIAGAQAAQSIQSANILKNTYMLLGATLATTSVVAFIAQAMRLPGMPLIVLLIGFYGLLYMIHKTKNSGAGLAWTFAFTGFMGLSLGPILNTFLSLENGASVIGNAFMMTALAFFALSAYALKTKRDLSFLEGFIFAGFIVLFSAMVLSWFVDISGMQMAISVGFVLFSSAVILYQTQSIVRGGEDNYILAAITLYVSIYNMFLSLMSLLGMGSSD